MKVQSNGMGVQSVAMYLMSSMGELPRFDYSIFADPGKEKRETYEYLEWLLDWQKENNGIPIIVDNSKNLFKDLMNNENSTGQRFASIPAFTKNEDGTKGMLRRQCTNEYKIAVVENNIKKLLGIKKGQSYSEEVELYIGISLDEVTRVSIPQRKNTTYVYPFCNYYRNKKKGWFGEFEKMNRHNILSWYKEKGFPIPPKSSCVFCPFQSDYNWLELKRNNPEDFAEAVKLDKEIRNSSKRGITQPIYLHESCKPLDEVELNENQTEIEFNCSPFCHT